MTKSKSLLRREEYRALAKLHVDGAILDVGGVRASGYQHLLQGDHTYTTANLSIEDADIAFDAEKTWPIENGKYDAVMFLNVLEHLYDYRTAISEAHRVLSPGGKVISCTPFMFNVHGSPSDYFRYTKSALERIFSDAGFESVEITELGTGAFSVIYHTLLAFVPWKWVASLLIPVALGLDRFISWIRPNNHMSATYMPLGYLLIAHKTKKI